MKLRIIVMLFGLAIACLLPSCAKKGAIEQVEALPETIYFVRYQSYLAKHDIQPDNQRLFLVMEEMSDFETYFFDNFPLEHETIREEELSKQLIVAIVDDRCEVPHELIIHTMGGQNNTLYVNYSVVPNEENQFLTARQSSIAIVNGRHWERVVFVNDGRVINQVLL